MTSQISFDNKGIAISVSAPGKVILHGEHSVVYGKIAIAGSLGLRTTVKLTETTNDFCTFNSKALNFEQSFDVKKIQKNLLDIDLPVLEETTCTVKAPHLINYEHLILRIEEFLATSDETSHVNQNQAMTAALYLLTGILSGIAIKPFDLVVDTDLAVGAGCGSSASFSVCLAGIFLLYMHLKQESGDIKPKTEFTDDEKDLISNWAFSVERIMHGTPSGIDNTVCAYGLLLTFKKGGEKKIVNIKRELNILLINTKVPRSTKTQVAIVSAMYEKNTDIINYILNALDSIAQTAVSYLQNLNEKSSEMVYTNLGELMDLNQNLLRTLNVSHETLDKICAILSEYGLHGKLTGAGGGGYAIAIVPPFYDRTILNELIDKLFAANFDVILTDIGGPGVTIN